MKIEEITIDEYNVHVINSIKKKYPELRQRSKSPTFALTYAGTSHTLQKNLRFSEEEAKRIEAKYHEMYKVSDEWVKSKITKAQSDGFVTCAFGLKLRTPLLKKAIMGTKQTLREAEAEARTAGNALGQSWCLLNCRSANEVMEQVWASPYAKDILPVAQIHDALYFFIRDNLDIIVWFNKILIKAMEWQEDPAIAHDQVKLGGDLEIFFPDWAHPIEIPNNATKEDILRILKNEKNNE
jgi:DNA polymerase-1